ncbi:hypothetical protein SUGI_1110180 [Cryptomeria japonica]|nr:hypothetical protein SUGI_1110180 [Cryptomeria japonica]
MVRGFPNSFEGDFKDNLLNQMPHYLLSTRNMVEACNFPSPWHVILSSDFLMIPLSLFTEDIFATIDIELAMIS